MSKLDSSSEDSEQDEPDADGRADDIYDQTQYEGAKSFQPRHRAAEGEGDRDRAKDDSGSDADPQGQPILGMHRATLAARPCCETSYKVMGSPARDDVRVSRRTAAA
jgi:hypothetical protein